MVVVVQDIDIEMARIVADRIADVLDSFTQIGGTQIVVCAERIAPRLPMDAKTTHRLEN
jgi:hypothetical protein